VSPRNPQPPPLIRPPTPTSTPHWTRFPFNLEKGSLQNWPASQDERGRHQPRKMARNASCRANATLVRVSGNINSFFVPAFGAEIGVIFARSRRTEEVRGYTVLDTTGSCHEELPLGTNSGAAKSPGTWSLLACASDTSASQSKWKRSTRGSGEKTRLIDMKIYINAVPRMENLALAALIAQRQIVGGKFTTEKKVSPLHRSPLCSS